ncbi:MAG: SurA N-terminal domain-containing protein [Bacteroidota bacterium]
MSTLRRIRQNMVLIVIVILIALLGFILTDLFSSLGSVFAAPPDYGSVAGKTITYQDFNERYQQQLQQVNGSDEVASERIKDQVWNQMVNEIIFDKEFEDIGLETRADELYDLMAGDHISQGAANVFFGGNLQGYDKDLAKTYLQNLVDGDEESQNQLALIEEYLARERNTTKLGNIMNAAYLSSSALARQKYKDQNAKRNVSFLAVNYAQVPDSAVNVTDSDLQNYINENSARFEQEDQTTIRFAKFDIIPSPQDSAKSLKQLAGWRKSFAETENDSTFSVRRSDNATYQEDYLPVSRLPISLQESFVGGTAGDVFGPVLEGNYYRLYKLVGTQEVENPSVKINQIQINITGGDTTAARDKARSIARQANAGNFSDLMEENNGVEMGWFNAGVFGADFDEAVQKASVGQIVGPVKGNRGFHVVQVLAKTNLGYNIASVEDAITFSDSTRNAMYIASNLFADTVRVVGDINLAGQAKNILVDESDPLTNQSLNLKRTMPGGRKLILWALFEEKGASTIEPYRVGDAFIVAQVTDKKYKGLQNVASLRDQIEPTVRNKKKAELIIKELNALGGGSDLNALKDSYSRQAFVNTANDISFESTTIPGIGNDAKIIGKVAGMAQGETSAPMEGQNGVYVVQVTSVTDAAEPDEATIATLKTSDVGQNQFALRNKLSEALKDIADVQDERAEAESALNGN